MKNILVAIPTFIEGKAFIENLKLLKINDYKFSLNYKNNKYTFIFTGVGTPPNILILTEEFLKNYYDLLITFGIAGTYNENFEPEEPLLVTQDYFADLGIKYKNVVEMGLPFSYVNKMNKKIFTAPKSGLDLDFKKTSGATFNSVSETLEQAKERKKITNAELETMENAAFFLVANYFKVPLISIRTISNTAGDRNKNNWFIKEATTTLYKTFLKITEKI